MVIDLVKGRISSIKRIWVGWGLFKWYKITAGVGGARTGSIVVKAGAIDRLMKKDEMEKNKKELRKQFNALRRRFHSAKEQNEKNNLENQMNNIKEQITKVEELEKNKGGLIGKPIRLYLDI